MPATRRRRSPAESARSTWVGVGLNGCRSPVWSVGGQHYRQGPQRWRNGGRGRRLGQALRGAGATANLARDNGLDHRQNSRRGDADLRRRRQWHREPDHRERRDVETSSIRTPPPHGRFLSPAPSRRRWILSAVSCPRPISSASRRTISSLSAASRPATRSRLYIRERRRRSSTSCRRASWWDASDFAESQGELQASFNSTHRPARSPSRRLREAAWSGSIFVVPPAPSS